MNAAERDVRRLLARALRAGYTLERTRGGHWRVRCPDGSVAVTMSGTVSDHRGRRNALRDLHRAGVPL